MVGHRIEEFWSCDISSVIYLATEITDIGTELWHKEEPEHREFFQPEGQIMKSPLAAFWQ